MESRRMSTIGYEKLAEEANKPLSRREAVAQGRGGKKQVPRRYHVTDEKYAELRSKIAETGKFVSPFRKGGGAYNAIVESLVLLGENQAHDVGVAFAKFEEYLRQVPSRKKDAVPGQTAWDDYDNKESRSEETGQDGFGRFLQNCRVLQRLSGANQYGFKLAQFGACIDILKPEAENGNIRVRLRTGITDMVIPVQETKSRSYKQISGVKPGSLGLKAETKEPSAGVEAETLDTIAETD